MTTANHDSKLAQINAFEKRYGYDTSYMRAMLEHAPKALEIFNQFVPMAGYREHAPLEVYFAAKLTAYRVADCGPCLQLAVRLAQEAGVDDDIISALVLDKGELPEDLKRVQSFARACLENSPEYEAIRSELSWQYGKAVMIELALTIAAAQIFPVVKRATGHYKSCSLVTVAV